jgi:hypothetical protein
MRIPLIPVFILTVAALTAQQSASLRGVLTDSSGAVIPAVSVAITGNGVQKSAQTQADGSYVFPGLAEGDYRIAVTYPGFIAYEHAVTIQPGVAVPAQSGRHDPDAATPAVQPDAGGVFRRAVRSHHRPRSQRRFVRQRPDRLRDRSFPAQRRRHPLWSVRYEPDAGPDAWDAPSRWAESRKAASN